jgi:hypothetical protein
MHPRLLIVSVMLGLVLTLLARCPAAGQSDPPTSAAPTLVQAAGEMRYRLLPGPSAVDNPLKGLVPYVQPPADRFPHSMEFNYLPMSAVMVGEQAFDWQPLESLLNDVASRGNQTIVRFYLEYPGQQAGIPTFLIDQGLKVHTYTNTNTAPLPPQEVRTPDYEDRRLRQALRRFILAFGERFDGDPRLAYITAGLLGTWGEWHTYPRNDLWASKAVQAEVLDAYTEAFATTPVLLRYPAGPDSYDKADNASRPMGFHDDSFAWGTLETGRADDSWFFLAALRAAGEEAMNRWKTHPIGGEIRPEAWGKIFDSRAQWPQQAQDFSQCVAETHATWLMDSGMFGEVPSPQRLANAQAQVARMGYDFYIPQATIQWESQHRLAVAIDVINQGVAPFYASWPTELSILDERGQVLHQVVVAEFSFRGILPSDQPHSMKASVSLPTLPSGSYAVAIRIVQPLAGGKPVRFANADQDRHLAGWLTLATIEKP